MKFRTILFSTVLFLFHGGIIDAQKAVLSSSSSDPYKDKVTQERKAKDTQYRDPKRSPLEASDIAGFTGLKYYSYNSKFRVNASLEKVKDGKTIRMKTTTERRPEYIVWAYAHFTIDGKKHQLTIYQPVDLMKEKGFENYLFLPFTDETSGRETYGGGRFLELTIPQGNSMIIDFNTAFNPYCAYNSKYSCPVPPEENDLNIKIEAGELPLKTHSKH